MLNLRTNLIGRSPADRAGLLQSAVAGGRNGWFEGLHLSAQAITDLATIAVAPAAPGWRDHHSVVLAAREVWQRDRIGRWEQHVLVQHPAA